MLDRTAAPAFETIQNVNFQRAEKFVLNNGIPVFTLNAGSQELCRIDLIFKAGTLYQSKPLLAVAVSDLLESGTSKYSAKEFSEEIDFFGSFIEPSAGTDYASVSLFSLNKFLKESLPFLENMVKDPTFPQTELETWVSIKKQKFLTQQKKVSTEAKKKFANLLFGNNHPYGKMTELAHFDGLSRKDLISFFKTHYNSTQCTIIAAGCLPDFLLESLNQLFGSEPWGHNSNISAPKTEPFSLKERIHFSEKPQAVQSAIRIGRRLFNKTHPDYFKFQVLNTVLGGYFGSRLMANIREDKGYTYGIGTGLHSYTQDGYFFISTEVGAEVTSKALHEIYFEMDRLQREPIPENELTTVKNYLLGQFLRSADGPFSQADLFRSMWEFDLDYDYFNNFIRSVQETTSLELQQLAKKYLSKENMVELVVGKK